MTHGPPWNVRRPQPAIRNLVEDGLFTGRVLDVGCGYGENTLLIAASGRSVTGIDLDAEGLRQAVGRSRELSLEGRARFIRFDVRRLAEFSEAFDTVLDSLVFHSFEGRARREYVAGLRRVTRPGGRLHVLCYSDRHVGPPSPPHKVSRADISEAFADGWSVDEVRTTTSISTLAPDGITSWLVTCTRDREES